MSDNHRAVYATFPTKCLGATLSGALIGGIFNLKAIGSIFGAFGGLWGLIGSAVLGAVSAMAGGFLGSILGGCWDSPSPGPRGGGVGISTKILSGALFLPIIIVRFVSLPEEDENKPNKELALTLLAETVALGGEASIVAYLLGKRVGEQRVRALPMHRRWGLFR